MLRVLWAAVIADSQSQWAVSAPSCTRWRWSCTAQGVACREWIEPDACHGFRGLRPPPGDGL